MMRVVYLLPCVVLIFVGSMMAQSTKVCMIRWFPASTFGLTDPAYDTKVQPSGTADACITSCKDTTDCLGFDYHFANKTCRFFKLDASKPLTLDWFRACDEKSEKQAYLKMVVPESSKCTEKELIEMWYSNTTTTLPNGQKYGIKQAGFVYNVYQG